MKTTEALNNAIAEREAHMEWDENTNTRSNPDGEQYTEEYARERIENRAKEYQEEENKLKKYEQGIGQRILPNIPENTAREIIRKRAEGEREIEHDWHEWTRFEPGYRTDKNREEYRIEEAWYQVEQREIELFNERKEYKEAYKEQQNFKS